MHKLSRGQGPRCLKKYKYGQDRWSKSLPSSEEKTEIWQALEAMQGKRCAYCEADVDSDQNKHIEHFRQRAAHRYPQGTFDWENLFGSCGRKDSCGKHKDQCGEYDHELLIKPDSEDPEHFLHFHSDGKISPHEGINLNEKRRALETLRIFNLDAENGALHWRRHDAAIGYVQTAEEILELAGDDLSLVNQLIQDEIDRTKHLPFATAIKHTLMLCR